MLYLIERKSSRSIFTASQWCRKFPTRFITRKKSNFWKTFFWGRKVIFSHLWLGFVSKMIPDRTRGQNWNEPFFFLTFAGDSSLQISRDGRYIRFFARLFHCNKWLGPRMTRSCTFVYIVFWWLWSCCRVNPGHGICLMALVYPRSMKMFLFRLHVFAVLFSSEKNVDRFPNFCLVWGALLTNV